MNTYFRRLRAALLGRRFEPLELGEQIWFTSPGGTPLCVEISQVSYHQESGRTSVLTVEARSPVHRLRRVV